MSPHFMVGDINTSQSQDVIPRPLTPQFNVLPLDPPDN